MEQTVFVFFSKFFFPFFFYICMYVCVYVCVYACPSLFFFFPFLLFMWVYISLFLFLFISFFFQFIFICSLFFSFLFSVCSENWPRDSLIYLIWYFGLKCLFIFFSSSSVNLVTTFTCPHQLCVTRTNFHLKLNTLTIHCCN